MGPFVSPLKAGREGRLKRLDLRTSSRFSVDGLAVSGLAQSRFAVNGLCTQKAFYSQVFIDKF